MKIIISPAKKMNIDTDTLPVKTQPCFKEDTEQILHWMQTLTYAEAKALWGCNDKIAELNYARFSEMDLENNLTPALLSYEGIQYQYMAPKVFTQSEWGYVQDHLRILSGFYGVLKPLDGVVPYRLEMQAKTRVKGTKDLYGFWSEKLYCEVAKKDRIIVNLASKEYSKCIEKYLTEKDIFITCIFGEWKNEKVIQKGTMAKMARGEMVRFMAENQLENPKDMQKFNRLGYHFDKELSSEKEYIFIKDKS
ncbi:MAG: peroxide stress protein YaaA [Lachnospiraceae bacterium]